MIAATPVIAMAVVHRFPTMDICILLDESGDVEGALPSLSLTGHEGSHSSVGDVPPPLFKLHAGRRSRPGPVTLVLWMKPQTEGFAGPKSLRRLDPLAAISQ